MEFRQGYDVEGLHLDRRHGSAGAGVRPRNAGLQVYDGEILDGVGPRGQPIVERDIWDSVCALLADPKRHTGKSPGRKHLLSGIAICGVCHRPIGSAVRSTKDGNRAVYQCKRLGCMKIVRDLVQTDKRVVVSVTGRLAAPDATATLVKPTVNTTALPDQIDMLRAQITEAEADYDDGEITAARMNARIDRVNAKLAPLEDKLLGAHMSRDVKDLAGKRDAAQRFAKLPLDRRRGVIDTLATGPFTRSARVAGSIRRRSPSTGSEHPHHLALTRRGCGILVRCDILSHARGIRRVPARVVHFQSGCRLPRAVNPSVTHAGSSEPSSPNA